MFYVPFFVTFSKSRVNVPLTAQLRAHRRTSAASAGGHHTGRPRLRESPSGLLMSDSEVLPTLCQGPGLSGGPILDGGEGNTASCPPLTKQSLNLTPPLTLSTACRFHLSPSSLSSLKVPGSGLCFLSFTQNSLTAFNRHFHLQSSLHLRPIYFCLRCLLNHLSAFP